jgi:1-acyl-sn-glycerol-3-phosphate acyltransferase
MSTKRSTRRLAASFDPAKVGHRTRAWRIVVAILKPPLHLTTHRQREGAEFLPAPGTGFIIAANHLNNLDFLPVVEFCYDLASPPAVLIKDSLWHVPIVGRALTAIGQIPVYRRTSHAADALVAARQALAAGACVLIYPEGTLTNDAADWPMRARPGVGRLALATGVPVIPLAQWGTQAWIGSKHHPVKVFPRPHIRLKAGPPVELGDLHGRTDAAAAREATSRVMRRITALVGELRGETPPAQPYGARPELGGTSDGVPSQGGKTPDGGPSESLGTASGAPTGGGGAR